MQFFNFDDKRIFPIRLHDITVDLAYLLIYVFYKKVVPIPKNHSPQEKSKVKNYCSVISGIALRYLKNSNL
jgi:hypothetical protein